MHARRRAGCSGGDGGPKDALDLGLKGVPGRGNRAPGIHLEILGAGVDLVAEFAQERLVGRSSGKDAARQEDHKPWTMRHRCSFDEKRSPQVWTGDARVWRA